MWRLLFVRESSLLDLVLSFVVLKERSGWSLGGGTGRHKGKAERRAKPQRGVHRTQRGRAEKCEIRRGWSRCAWPARPGDGPLALATLPHAANPRLERPQQPLRRRHVRTYRSGGGTRRSARALALGPRRGKRTGWPALELADASLERAASGGTSGALDSSDSSLRARVPEQGTRRLKETERAVDRRSARGRRPPSASPTRRARTRAARRRRRRPTRPRMSLSTGRRPRRPTQGSASATAARSRGAASRGPSPRWRRGRRRAAARLETGNAGFDWRAGRARRSSGATSKCARAAQLGRVVQQREGLVAGESLQQPRLEQPEQLDGDVPADVS